MGRIFDEGGHAGLRAALGAAAFFAMGVSVQAQTAEPTNLETLTVEGGGETATGPIDGYVANRTVSGTKTDTPLIETPQSISVVTRDQIEARGASNIGEALNYTTGVQTQVFGADPRFEGGLIRGFVADESFYLDNLKIIRTFSAPSIEQYGLERVDVVRGPASVLYGQASPGGLVNLVSKRPVFEPLREVQGEVGSFDRYQGAFDFGGPIDEAGTFAYRLTGLARDSGAQVDGIADDRYFIAPAFTWAPSGDTTVTFLSSLQHDRAGSPVGLPLAGTLEPNPNGRLAPSLYAGDPGFDSSESTRANIGYEIEHRINDVFTVRQNTRYSHLNFDYKNLYLLGLASDMRTLSRGTSLQRESLDTFNTDTHLQAEFDTGSISHDVVAGLDIRRFWADNQGGFGSAPSIDLFNPVYGLDIADPLITSDREQTIAQIGGYIQDQISFNGWRVTLAGRYDDTSQKTFDRLSQTTSRQDDSAFTGRAGVLYAFENGFSPYVNYSTSFNPAIGTLAPERGGGTFDPTEGEQLEAGLKYQPPGSNAYFTGAVFDLKQSNVLTPDPDYVGFNVQTGEINVRGLELEAVADFDNGFSLTAGYTFYDAEITADNAGNAGNRPANVPDHMIKIWGDYTFQEGARLAGLGFGAGARYLGERFGDNANTIELDATTLVDLGVHYERDNLRASLNVNNVFDEEYLSSCSAFGCYYGNGRTIGGKLTVRW
ncbi:TonB-dependent siderophore receptor [Pararhizobium haloflavum]|uniref:TonB-dependent siderophore receptor n=1 Tax=Pararhizobium haloflavum TaxID=2037914 RepID=UPI000C1A2314|nr:TonB-dependent siderophore receptor [Pararhizobium haloflavum]